MIKTAAKLSSVALAFALAACLGDTAMEDKIDFGRSTSFNGEVLRIEIDREDGSKEQFSTLRDRWYSFSWVPFLPNHSGRRWVMGKTDQEGTSFVYTLVSWDNDNPTDYLAAGYWMRFEGYRRDNDLPIAAADLFMFVDGSELDPALPPELPVSGTASYVGGASGIYTYSHGSGWPGYDGLEAAEEFVGTMTVEANFDDMTIAGCIGCVGDLQIDRGHLYGALGWRVAEQLAKPTNYEIQFAPTEITAYGNFLGEDVTVTHPTRTVAESGGEWGGNLSNQPAEDGSPRMVAGVASAAFTEDDGSVGAFNSIFMTVHPSLQSTSPR